LYFRASLGRDDATFGLPASHDRLDFCLRAAVGLLGGCSAQFRAKQLVEGRCQLTLDVVFIVYEQPLEERQIELATQRSASLSVGGMAVAGSFVSPWAHFDLGRRCPLPPHPLSP
jgi:hypothetical protein